MFIMPMCNDLLFFRYENYNRQSIPGCCKNAIKARLSLYKCFDLSLCYDSDIPVANWSPGCFASFCLTHCRYPHSRPAEPSQLKPRLMGQCSAYVSTLHFENAQLSRCKPQQCHQCLVPSIALMQPRHHRNTILSPCHVYKFFEEQSTVVLALSIDTPYRRVVLPNTSTHALRALLDLLHRSCSVGNMQTVSQPQLLLRCYLVPNMATGGWKPCMRHVEC